MSRPIPRTRSAVDLVVMGYSAPDASPEARRSMTDFTILLSQLAMIDVSITALPSYERVAQLIFKGEIDLAWLSPIPYISLARRDAVVPIVSHHRGGDAHYQGAIIVAATSRARTLANLKGKRAAWVDRHSASGFVMPRIELWEAGIDPRKAFASQKFYGSHDAVVRAVAEGRADFGATYARLAPNRSVKSGSWTQTKYAHQVRALATFGEIPSDVIAARADLDPKAREIITKAFLRIAKVTQGKQIIAGVFGSDDFRRADLDSYERLRDAAAGAVEDGLLELDGFDESSAEDEDSSSDRTMEIRPRARAESIPDADVLEDDEDEIEIEEPKLVVPRPPAPRPAAQPKKAVTSSARAPVKPTAARVSPPRPAIKPVPPRKS